jgi:hypothetical protein
VPAREPEGRKREPKVGPLSNASMLLRWVPELLKGEGPRDDPYLDDDDPSVPVARRSASLAL